MSPPVDPGSSDAYAIRTNNLSKVFGKRKVVDEVNLSIGYGEIYGFLGPNGAGKTTTILLIVGILQPTEGAVYIHNQPVRQGAYQIKHRIGVVPERLSFYEDMTALEYLMFFGDLYKARDLEKRVHSLLDRVDLWEWRNTLIGAYSLGMRKKLNIVRALIHSPDLLILDEPVSGLDPSGIVQIREILEDENANGRTILISSHTLSEVERLADRVGIMANGKMLIEASMAKILQIQSKQQIWIELAQMNKGLVDAIRTLPFVRKVQVDGRSITITTLLDRDYRTDISQALASHQGIILGMRSSELTLEDAFIQTVYPNLIDSEGNGNDPTAE
jgi:ABC-type multidrug transport system ATPase subunit